MNVNGTAYRTVWISRDGEWIEIIDQRKLPFAFEIETLLSVDSVAVAIRDMHVRGAGCIGATAGFGMWLAVREAMQVEAFNARLGDLARQLVATRPTAVNLRWAVDRQLRAIGGAKTLEEKLAVARETAQAIADEDAEGCRRIGEHGVRLIEAIAAKNPGRPVEILTHCNAGWLAFVDHGSATAPIYEAHRRGIPVHVWADETRPRNQGARLTAWELSQEGVPHDLIADNAGGHLMQRGRVDLAITGTDRTTRTGDVANKIGTYLKALAARDNAVPFYVALPSSTFDWEIADGVGEIPIEERPADEVLTMEAWSEAAGKEIAVRLGPEGTGACNPAFDVTPARLVSGLITERGICEANEAAIRSLFPS